MKTLAKLFSSEALVKIMRLFLMNKDTGFENRDVSKHCRTKPYATKTEITLLSSIGFVHKKLFYKDIETKKGVKKKKVSGWFLNKDFMYINALYDLLITSKSIDKKELSAKVKRTGKVKMLVLAGAFIKDPRSRLDILAVGDNINQKRFENVMRNLESEIGKELKYSAFTTDEFRYRVSMYDKLICDVFDFPHEIVFGASELSTEGLKNRK
ncbi:MAG: hypothetical protein IT284_02395 [Bacteroidetes bacterium]|nr:hypothetical protein [Bacteroidota bacterium]